MAWAWGMGQQFHGGPSTVNPSFATPNLHLIAHCVRSILSSHHHLQKGTEKKEKKKKKSDNQLLLASNPTDDPRSTGPRRPAWHCSALLCPARAQAPVLWASSSFFSSEAIVDSTRSAFPPSPAQHFAPLSRLQTPSRASVSPEALFATRSSLHCSALLCSALPSLACRC